MSSRSEEKKVNKTLSELNQVGASTTGRRWIVGRDQRAFSYSDNVKIQELSEGRWVAFVRLRQGSGSAFFPIGPVAPSSADVGWYLGHRSKEALC